MSSNAENMSEAEPSRPGSVLDSAWEDALRTGQTEDGGAGSVEAELAVVHLLRHARAVEPLAPADLDRLWREGVAPVITPVPWWRRRWLWGLAPVAATAALLVVVLRGDDPGQAPQMASTTQASPARALALQFTQLEADARRDLDTRVDQGRGTLRAELLRAAVGGTP